MSKEDPMGGTAFPTHGCTDGMSLLDHFAGQALQGIMADMPYHSRLIIDTSAYEWVPKKAYMMAEAMLNERKKKL